MGRPLDGIALIRGTLPAVDWTYLGHAGWLAEAAGLRLLFDPILDDPHQGGTYRVWPPRTVDDAALRPDFVLVSHAHGDHFDVRSLARLARRDADAVVITPDPLVATVARAVGFRVVREVPSGQRIELDGVRLILTPSRAPEPEWGVLVEAAHGVAWNQVDTVFASADEVRRVLELASAGRGVDLALVRGAPLLEIEAQIPGSLAFPFAAHEALLDQIAATGARAIVPSATGQRNARGAWLDHVAWPVSPDRAARDIALRCPGATVLPAGVGDVLRLRAGRASLERGAGRHLAAPTGAEADPRSFRPLAIPELQETASADRERSLAATIEPWIAGPLLTALGSALASSAARRGPLRLGLEVVFPSGPRRFTFIVDHGGAEVETRLEGEVDVLDLVTASALADVIAGTRAWEHVLLAGELRASDRGYRVTSTGLDRLPIAPTFLYYALPYAESTRRAVLRELDAVLAAEPPPWETT
jgi:hypothetical protein